MDECQWFLDCHEEKAAEVNHPTMGWVDICEKHVDWLVEDLHDDGSVNPTKMVPPMAAKHGKRLREILARAEGE